ncbi:hypothetical protein [Thermosulfurimonas sp. F29]|uniref:hypothetical protein n=1 Tax=Thermosulfurimonas sp. F29 TaxID=2867247 RepID=UPI001C830566|nr:hypothetical protein [Thermosulfurimonas sp. F29]MBX6424250.1 hypothetical protein [Thermosulfurimonas sp. F29]
MTKRTFYSLLISGKLGLGLVSGFAVSSAKAMSLEDCASGTPGVGLVSTPQGVEFYEAADPYGASAEIVLNVPGEGCYYQLPDRLNLVVGGLRPGDEVFVGIGTALDDPSILSRTENKIRIGGDIMILSHFSFGYPESWPSPGVPFEASPEETGACYIIPVHLPPDLAALAGEEYYLQVLVFPGGNQSWEEAKVSSPVRIRVQVQDCSPYGGSAY